MCSDSIFNLLKRVTDCSFLFLCKMLVFIFLPFLKLSAQISCPQSQYMDVRSALDQPLTTSITFISIVKLQESKQTSTRLTFMKGCCTSSVSIIQQQINYKRSFRIEAGSGKYPSSGHKILLHKDNRSLLLLFYC